MVTKMNEATTVIETHHQQQQNPAVVTITLHPQPNERENCDNISTITTSAITTTTTAELSNVSPTSCESDDSIERSQTLIKKSLKLDLSHSNNVENVGNRSNNNDDDEDAIETPAEKEDLSFKSPTSPKSPRGGNASRAGVLHQTSLTSQVEPVDDRKALRDALYQGIFHRHRRTIFAVGSFLRMLKSRNSQYNTIRSSSEACRRWFSCCCGGGTGNE